MTTPTLSNAIPTLSAADLAARTIQRRAVEAVIWGIPAVNFDLMFQSFVRDANAAVNQIAYWSRIPNWKNQTLKQGKPLKPDQQATELFASAGAEARAWFDVRYETGYAPYNHGSRWFFPADESYVKAVQTGFTQTNLYPTDARGTLYYFVYSSIKHPGAGQYYLFVTRDKNGNPLDGAATYRLHVPPKPPVRQYWSAVLYDFATHALIRNMPHASKSSQSPGLETNADGSVDVYFGPKAPDGKQSNWVPTDAKGRFEALFRFYGPEKPLFDKTWVLPDIEKM